MPGTRGEGKVNAYISEDKTVFVEKEKKKQTRNPFINNIPSGQTGKFANPRELRVQLQIIFKGQMYFFLKWISLEMKMKPLMCVHTR